MSGKGMQPRKGYNPTRYRDNYDNIFRKETMKTNQPNPPAKVLPWHREAAKALINNYRQDPIHEVIAAHDPHQETVRLLREAIDQIESGEQDTFGLTAFQENLCKEARAHLARVKGTQ